MAEPVSVSATAGIVAGVFATMKGIEVLVSVLRARNGRGSKTLADGTPCKLHVSTCERLATCETRITAVGKQVDGGLDDIKKAVHARCDRIETRLDGMVETIAKIGRGGGSG